MSTGQGQGEAADDLGKPGRLAGAIAVDHLQAPALLRQPRAAADGADQQAGQDQAGIDRGAGVDQVQRQMPHPGFVHARNVLPVAVKIAATMLAMLMLTPIMPPATPPAREAVIAADQLLRGHVEEPLGHLGRQPAFGHRPRAAANHRNC